MHHMVGREAVSTAHRSFTLAKGAFEKHHPCCRPFTKLRLPGREPGQDLPHAHNTLERPSGPLLFARKTSKADLVGMHPSLQDETLRGCSLWKYPRPRLSTAQHQEQARDNAQEARECGGLLLS
jgi:hypothetical protein